jgi:hypothetical protein
MPWQRVWRYEDLNSPPFMVQLIPKQEKKPIFGQLFFLIIAIGVFAGTITAFVVFEQLRGQSLETRESLEETLVKDIRPREKEMEQEIKRYQEQLTALEEILAKRSIFLAFFDVLERTTHPNIFFSSMTGTLHGERLELSGEANDFFAIEQQRLVWEEEDTFEEMNMGNINLSKDGAAAFKVDFVVKREISQF